MPTIRGSNCVDYIPLCRNHLVQNSTDILAAACQDAVGEEGRRMNAQRRPIHADDVSHIIREQIGSHVVTLDSAEVGTVISVGDGIARISGVAGAMSGEMLEFPGRCTVWPSISKKTASALSYWGSASTSRKAIPCGGLDASCPCRSETRSWDVW